MINDIRHKFVEPLRKMVMVARAHAKQELEIKMEEEKKGVKASEGEGPEVNVKVMGNTLPPISLKDEIKASEKQQLCYTTILSCTLSMIEVLLLKCTRTMSCVFVL